MEALFYKELLQGGIAWTRTLPQVFFPFLPMFPILAVGTVGDIPCQPFSHWCVACHVRGKELRGYRAMGAGPRYRVDAPAWLQRKPPKLGGIRKVLMALNLKAFEQALTRWAETLLGRPIVDELSPPQALALDGKAVRGSFDGLEKAAHLLSLLAHESGLTLAQTAVPNGGENKTNEHKTALRLLERMVLKGRLITGDAMFCQRDLSQQVIDAEGHYFWFVKGTNRRFSRTSRQHSPLQWKGLFSPSAAKNRGKRAGHNNDPRQGARPC